jgi:Xaa-Pro aminopeptidase/Xaa-Pro dipeptidase
MSNMKTSLVKERRKNILRYAKKNLGCDCVVTFEPENLFYLTGFWGEAIGVLEDRGATTTIIAPELEAERARTESVDCNVLSSQRGTGLLSSLASKISKKKSTCIDCQNYLMAQFIKKKVKSKFKISSEPFSNARIIKDSKEITILKQASKIIDDMFELCTQSIKKGQRESELQAILMSYAISHNMFDTKYKSTLNPLIVAGGPNGALPHAQVSQRKFVSGDLIVVDITLRYKGYISDSTRTFGLGRISDKAKNVYGIVKESQKLGLKAVKPNALCSDVDAACRTYINNNNYGKYFIHSTGHGIGIDVHESPTISYSSTTNLEDNMAITVEPGIYIPKKFGVRIEDSVIVKDKRPIVMHKFSKDLIIV